MVWQWTRALPGALALVLAASACEDTPLGPRAPAVRATTMQPSVQTTAYSGRSADSLIDVLSAQWTRLGHPEYRRQIDSWRQRELGTTRVSTLRDRNWRGLGPMMLLVSGDGAKQPPMITSHQEAMYFGSKTSTSSVPNTIQSEMVFYGDQGRISVTSFSIVSNSGMSYSTSGVIASGPGQLLCTNVTLGSCTSQERLNGVLTIGGAICDAVGSGNINYVAENLQTTSGFNAIPGAPLSTDGTVQSSYSLSAHLQTTAPACPPPPPKDTLVQQPLSPAPPDTPPPSFPSPAPEPLPAPAPPPPIDGCSGYMDPVELIVQVDCDPI